MDGDEARRIFYRDCVNNVNNGYSSSSSIQEIIKCPQYKNIAMSCFGEGFFLSFNRSSPSKADVFSHVEVPFDAGVFLDAVDAYVNLSFVS